MKSMPIKPTESELEILQVLWQCGPSTVRQVNEKLSEKKETGYTTTLKLMQIMAEKGMLERDEQARSHIYKPLLKEKETQGHLLSRFLDATFKGSASSLVMQLLGNNPATKEELKEIKSLIEKLEGEQK